jgi:hypothetical protein
MSRRDEVGPVQIFAFLVVVLLIVGTVVLAVLSAVHDANHCVRWESYTYMQCETYGCDKHGNGCVTTCEPVDAQRCKAWDDVPGSGGTP